MAVALSSAAGINTYSIASCPGTPRRNFSYNFDPSRSNSGSEIVRLPSKPHSGSSTRVSSPTDEKALVHESVQAAPSSSHEHYTDIKLDEWLDDGMLRIVVGHSKKAFAIRSDLLTERSEYFRRLVSTPSLMHASYKPISFPDFDELSFTLFGHWLCGKVLPSPHDFHTLQHYLGLYCISRTLEIEALSNEAIDQVRKYYRARDMTAPPFRLDFIFKNTTGPCSMRTFLIATAAYRLLKEGHLSQVMTDLVQAGGELPSCLMEMILRLNKGGIWDPRSGPDCVWHEHKITSPCLSKEHTEIGGDASEILENLSRMSVDGN